MPVSKPRGAAPKAKRYASKRSDLDAKKAWVRDAAIGLVAAGAETVRTQRNRQQMVFAAVDVAARIWDHVEGKYMPEMVKAETDGKNANDKPR